MKFNFLPQLSMLTHPEFNVRLRPGDLHATPLEGVQGHTFAELEEPARAFAERLLPLVLPTRELELLDCIADYLERARNSPALRKVFEQSPPHWAGVLVATSLECWIFGVQVTGTSADWNPETLLAAARVLRSEKRPIGLEINAEELYRTATTLELLARQTKLISLRTPIGRPRNVSALLFERLQGPLEHAAKAERARLTSDLLAELCGIQVTYESILEAAKADARRARAKRERLAK